MDNGNAYLDWCSASIGHIIDRTIGPGEALGCGWLIDENTAVSCAHLLVPYENHLPALVLRFPASGQEFSIEGITYHPEFDLKQAAQLSKRAGSATTALQNQNVALLKLSKNIPQITDEFKAEVNSLLAQPAAGGDKAISGSLEELDLALVVQTLANARKQGTLTISDARNRPVARFYCKDGNLLHAHFGDLVNETAIYQFVSQRMSGHFYFSARKEPDWTVQTPISRPTDMMLIEAYRRVDEIPKMLGNLSGVNARYKRVVELPSVNGEYTKTVQQIWPLINGKTSIGQLWRAAKLDDYTIFSAMTELLKAKNIVEVSDQDTEKGAAPQIIDMAPELPLAAWDEISAITVQPVSGIASMHQGHLLGSLRPGDPWHLLHNVELPSNCAGIPVFKTGKVIGIHCGTLPADSKATALTNLNQLIWIEAVNDCIEQAEVRSSAAEQRIQAAASIEVASVECPKCGTSSLDSAKFCKRCGQQLLRDLDDEDQIDEPGKKKISAKVMAAVAFFIVLLVGAEFMNLAIKPAPHVVATNPVVDPVIERADVNSTSWKPIDNLTVKNGEMIRFDFKVKKPGHIYVLMKGTTSSAAQMIYPPSKEMDKPLKAEETIVIPEDSPPEKGVTHVAMSGLSVFGQPGTEQILILGSDSPASLLKYPEIVAKVFDGAVELLKNDEQAQAVQVPAPALGEHLVENAATTSADPPTVSVQLVKIKHVN
jgi:hypothetical protein